MFGIITSVLYLGLYCYLSVIFIALISSLVCPTSLHYCKRNLAIWPRGPPTAGVPAMVQMVKPALLLWTLILQRSKVDASVLYYALVREFTILYKTVK